MEQRWLGARSAVFQHLLREVRGSSPRIFVRWRYFSRGGSLGARLLGEASSAKGRTSSVRYLCRSCLNMYSTITSWANSTPAYLAPSVSQYEAQICLRQAAEKQKGYVGFRVQLGCDASRCRVDPCSAGTSYIPQFWREKTNISDHRQGSIQA